MGTTTGNFELVDSAAVAAFGVTFSEFMHAPTGARHFHFASDDPHNAFMVAFPTLPENSTGVAHILEHTTLCGSQRFPVRDPFFMMLRRSLNTYMNAFTSGDTTAYPFATQNHKDFENLLSVYLDAVFFPHLHPLDFMQEGWRLEHGEDTALELHGVVYNEMKGAMSSPLSQLWQHVHAALFPDAVYHHNSGGDPLAIPDLTHADLRAFHATHYHPSNAVFMTYGDLPAASHQENFERQALADFHDRRSALVCAPQPLFTAPREVVEPYSVETDAARQTHMVWGWIVGDSTDAERVMDAHLLSAVLLEHGASPLRHFLETTDLANAPSELCGIDDSSRHLVFVCGVEGSEVAHAGELQDRILGVLEAVARDGVDTPTLTAIVDRLELAQRDLGGGSYPFGLQLMNRIMPAAMYRGSALPLLDLAPAIDTLRNKLADPGYLRSLVQQLLLNNPHRVRVLMAPDVAKAARDAAAENKRLEGIAQSLDAAAQAAIDDTAAALRARQAEEDDDSILPRVTLADVPPARPLQAPRRQADDGLEILAFPCAANGVFRVRLAIALPELSAAELAVMPLFCEYITELGHGDESYLEVQARRALSGNFSVYALARSKLDVADAMHGWLVVGGTGLARKREEVLAIVAEIIGGARFDETRRLHELLAQSRAEGEASVTDRGHQLAILAAARGFSNAAALDELWDGPSAIRLVERLSRQPQDAPPLKALMAQFDSIRQKLAGAPRRVALIGEEQDIAGAEAGCSLMAPGQGTTFQPFSAAFDARATGPSLLVNSQVNFCAKAYAAAAPGTADAPVLAVLGRYLQDGFLHREIREQGGAYGSGASYDGDSATFRFFSYRDPRALDTFADFDRAIAWFADAADPQRLEESILGTIRALDQPRAPAGEAERAFIAGLCERGDDYRRTFRERVLALTHADLVTVGARWLQPARGARAIITGAREADALGADGFKLERLHEAQEQS